MNRELLADYNRIHFIIVLRKIDDKKFQGYFPKKSAFLWKNQRKLLSDELWTNITILRYCWIYLGLSLESDNACVYILLYKFCALIFHNIEATTKNLLNDSNDAWGACDQWLCWEQWY